MFGLFGDKDTMYGLVIDKRFFTTSNVSNVAVAVKAMIFTDGGTMHRMSPMSENATLKSSPLQCKHVTCDMSYVYVTPLCSCISAFLSVHMHVMPFYEVCI